MYAATFFMAKILPDTGWYAFKSGNGQIKNSFEEKKYWN